MNSAPQKKGLFSGGSQRQRLLTVVGGAGVLLVVFGIIFSLIFGSSTSNTEKLVQLATQQTEIIRIAEVGEKQATSTDTKNYASTVRLAVASAHNQLISLLSGQGRKVNSEELEAAKDTNTDEVLTAAAQSNRFNEIFTQELDKELRAYLQEISRIYESSDSNKEKQALQTIFNQTNQLTATQE